MRFQRNSGSPFAVLILFAAYAAIHSLLASNPVKAAAARVFGERRRNGLYRPFYIVQSVLATVWAVRLFVKLPDRTLYKARPPCSSALYALQAAGLALLVSALNATGLTRILGLPQLVQFARGERPAREAEAQGPPLAATGERMDARGPFRHVRHPENLAFVILLWTFPRMTVNRLTVAVLATLYAIVGSKHEDARLEAAYGKPFKQYAARTPMLVPRIARNAGPDAM